MESTPLDAYTFLTEKFERLQLDLESILRKAQYFQKENPQCMTLELSILLGYLYTSPLQRPDLWDFAKAQEILATAENDVKQYCKSLYNDEIEEAEVRNGYLLIIYNFLLSMLEKNLLVADSYKRCHENYEKVRRACGKKSAACIHAFIAFAVYIFGEKSLMELALRHMTKALEAQDVLKNYHWLYIKVLILDKILTPTLYIANTRQCSEDKFHAEVVSLCDDLQQDEKYKDWASVMQAKYSSSNEESSVQSARSNKSETTPTIILCAKMCIKQGDCNKAKNLLEDLPEKSDEVLFLQGYASKDLSRMQSEPSSNNILSTEQTQQHHLEDALQFFQGAIISNPNNLDARMHKAITLALLGKADESHKELQNLKFMLTKRNLPVDILVFHAELLKFEKCLGLSYSQIQQCVCTVIKSSLEHFEFNKEEKKRVQFSIDYINVTVDMVLEKLTQLHDDEKEDSDIAKTFAWVLLNLQLYKEAKHIYKLLHTKLQKVYDPDVVLGLARAYHGLRELEKVHEMVEILKKDEKMAHLADKITEEFGQPADSHPIKVAIDNKDQLNYQRRERSRSFSALPPQSVSVSGQRSVLTRRVSGDSLTTTRTEQKHCENMSSTSLPPRRSSDNLKGTALDQLKLNKDAGPSMVVSTRKLSLVAGAIVSRRKEFAREHLDLEEPEIIDIESTYRDNSKEAAFQMLYRWKERSGLKATTNCLYDMLQSSKKFPEDILLEIRTFLCTGEK